MEITEMKDYNRTARTKFNVKAMAFMIVLTILFSIMFVFGLYCTLTQTVPSGSFLSEGFMKGFIKYCTQRGITNAMFCAATFTFYFRVHNIDDLFTQSGSYEMRWLGMTYIGIWALNIVARFFVDGLMFPPHLFVFLGVVCIILFAMIKALSSRVDMYLNTDGGHRRIGDMTPFQFIEFIASLFKKG